MEIISYVDNFPHDLPDYCLCFNSGITLLINLKWNIQLSIYKLCKNVFIA